MGQIFTKDTASIRHKCLEYMEEGGHTSEERMECFRRFLDPGSKDIQAFYNVWGTNYDEDMQSSNYNDSARVVQWMAFLFPERKDINILDIGAGTGANGKRLHALGYFNIDALDGSPGMLDIAQSLNVYTNIYQEILEKNQKVESVPEAAYDVIISSGSFFPFHLQGYHIPCFVNCVKQGGLLILSGAPHNDNNLGMRPALEQLKKNGVLEVLREEFVPQWYRFDDGTIWILKKL